MEMLKLQHLQKCCYNIFDIVVRLAIPMNNRFHFFHQFFYSSKSEYLKRHVSSLMPLCSAQLY